MAFSRNAVAIDLGAHSIKVVDVTVSPAGVHVGRALHVERSELASLGLEPGNAEQLARMLRERMVEARISARGVILGIGGQDCMMRYTRIPPVPAWRLKVIMQYEASEVAEKIGEPLASGYRPLQLAREADEDQTILIGLAKEKPLQDLLDALESAGIVVERVIPGAIAVFSAHDAFGKKADPDSPEDDLVLVADMGAENLSIALVLNDKLAFARSVTFGGKNFTEALAQGLGISPADAEKLKVARGGLDEREKGVHPDSVMYLRAASGQLLGMLQASLRFASTQIGVSLPALSRVSLLGGGMRLRGLPAFLTQGLGKPAELFSPSGVKLSSDLPQPVAKALSEKPGDFGAALGLGASRLREGSGTDAAKSPLSLLPAKYAKRREFKDRTLFLYAAGALLVVFLCARLAHAIYANVSASSVRSQLEGVHAALDAKKKELDQTVREAEKRKARLNRLLRESELTAFQAYVLDLLSRVVRPEIQLEKIHMDLGESEDDTSFDYNLRVAGRVNNEKRQGLDWILELQSALKAEERIASVEVESSRPDGAWYTFELSLRPNYVSY